MTDADTMYTWLKYALARWSTSLPSTATRRRYRSDLPELTPKYRLALGSRTFTIVSARNPAEADVELVLQCTEVVT